MIKSVFGRLPWWKVLPLHARMGSSYQPLLPGSRSRSMPTAASFLPGPSISSFSSKSDSSPDEVDDASTAVFNPKLDCKQNSKENSKEPGGKRKLGIFLAAAAAGSVAATAWSYSDLKNLKEGEKLSAARVITDDFAKDKPNTPTRRERFNFIADVVDETGSSLVYITIKNLRVSDYFTGEPTTASTGSGFIVKEDGLILTNAHVVAGKPRDAIQVQLQDGRNFLGTVEDVDMKTDLATVRIPCKNLPVMRLGNSSKIRPGEFVIAMGSPLALSNTITTGVVSSAARNRKECGIRNKEYRKRVKEYIQTDAAITFGNSGGPLINLDGEAIGINSLNLCPGISFAIPIDYAKEFLQKSEQRKKSGALKTMARKRRYMGVSMLAITDQTLGELRTRLHIPSEVNHGIIMFRIVIGSPADRAGLRPGDIITNINGKEVHESGDVWELLDTTEDLHITAIREGATMEFLVKPE